LKDFHRIAHLVLTGGANNGSPIIFKEGPSLPMAILGFISFNQKKYFGRIILSGCQNKIKDEFTPPS
jgi:hypothetical protein